MGPRRKAQAPPPPPGFGRRKAMTSGPPPPPHGAGEATSLQTKGLWQGGQQGRGSAAAAEGQPQMSNQMREYTFVGLYGGGGALCSTRWEKQMGKWRVRKEWNELFLATWEHRFSPKKAKVLCGFLGRFWPCSIPSQAFTSRGNP